MRFGIKRNYDGSWSAWIDETMVTGSLARCYEFLGALAYLA